MRDIKGAYDKAGERLGRAWGQALSALPERQAPSIDELWQKTTVGDVLRLAKNVGKEKASAWIEYMWRKEQNNANMG